MVAAASVVVPVTRTTKENIETLSLVEDEMDGSAVESFKCTSWRVGPCDDNDTQRQHSCKTLQ